MCVVVILLLFCYKHYVIKLLLHYNLLFIIRVDMLVVQCRVIIVGKKNLFLCSSADCDIESTNNREGAFGTEQQRFSE